MEGRHFVTHERGQTGRLQLHTAACKGELRQVVDLLQRGAQPNAPSRLPSDNGRQALHLAALGGHPDVMHELLKRGANPDAADHQGFRPLHIAAQQGAVNVVKHLHHANVNLKTQTKAGWQAVHLAAGGGHVDVLKLLQDYHCNLAAPDFSSATPLHHAASRGHLDAVRWLIRAGVPFNVKDKEGMSAADRAEENDHHDIYVEVTAAEKRRATRHKTGKRYRSQPNLPDSFQKPTVEIPRPKTSDIPLESPSSPHLYRSLTHPFSFHNHVQTPHTTVATTVIPSTTPPPDTLSLGQQSSKRPHALPTRQPPKSPPPHRQPPKSPPPHRQPPKSPPPLRQPPKSSPTQRLPPKSPPPLRQPPKSPPTKRQPQQSQPPKSPPPPRLPPKSPKPQRQPPESPPLQRQPPKSPPPPPLPPKSPKSQRQPPESPPPQHQPPKPPPPPELPPKSPKPERQPPESHLLQHQPSKSPQPQCQPPESPPLQHQPPKSTPPQPLPPKSPPSQRQHPKSPSTEKAPSQDTQTPQSSDVLPSHDEQTPASPTQNKESVDVMSQGPCEPQDTSLPPSPGPVDPPPSTPVTSSAQPSTPIIHSTSTVTSASSTLSLSSTDLSPSPTASPSSSPLLPKEEGKPVKKGDKKNATLQIIKNMMRKMNSKTKITKPDGSVNSTDFKEEIAGDSGNLGHGENSSPITSEAPIQARDGCSLGTAERNNPAEPPQQEAAFLDLDVQAALRPFREGPDVYPCTSNPRGIAIILNNKSFHDRPDLTRYGSECDTKNLEDVFVKMGYVVRTRGDLTRQDTLEWFHEVSTLTMLQSVSCLFVFILSHGEGRKVFCTYDNQTVNLDEVQSCFLNQSCPGLKGKPKVFFSHFCRGADEETQSQYSADATREAYKDMLCLYSSTEGFQALRHHRLGTPSVRALCRTLAHHAHLKHFRDIVQEFQKLYETMEGATSPEVQDFKFKKDFYLNPIGKSSLY